MVSTIKTPLGSQLEGGRSHVHPLRQLDVEAGVEALPEPSHAGAGLPTMQVQHGGLRWVIKGGRLARPVHLPDVAWGEVGLDRREWAHVHHPPREVHSACAVEVTTPGVWTVKKKKELN